MAPHRRNIGASRRRRREDDGEEGGSVAGELDDDSLSEGTELSHQEDDDADGESSDGSEEGKASTSTPQPDRANGQINGRVSATAAASLEKSGKESTVSDTEAMMGGLDISAGSEGVAETEREEQKRQQQQKQQKEGRSSVPPLDSRRDLALGDKKRREQDREPRERDKNPAVVPTRGSFFLHDKRSTESGSNGSSNSKTFNKPKSRPHGLIVDGNAPRNPPKSDASRGPWTHDLHDTVAGDEPPSALKPSAATNMGSNAGPPVASNPVPTAPRSSPPNRSFSNTVLIGNVPAVVFLPGMSQPTPVRAVPKKQHTRLPQHRPPLRRDKPVRISLPGQQPRYIFPSTERSFIFIPRALRPNQQAYRGRGGRGGFFGGRRSSIYANSAYSPSISLSRRSSLGRGMPSEGFHSPAGSVLPKAAVLAGDNSKPVVRLPPTRPPGGFPPVPGAGPPMPGAVPATMPPPPHPHHHPLPPQPQYPAYRESRPAPIPMHQPRPQKTVSVADIETPAAYGFNPPQPQQEQPFHHQVPVPAAANGAAYPPDASGPPPPPLSTHTPLSHIPERAIHAQPFQPYDFSQQQQQQPQQQQAFYPPTYPPGSMYYPVSGSEFPPYNATMGPGPSFAPASGQQMPYMMPAATVPPPASMAEQQPSQTGTVAHEAGGTVYFYDASQMYQNPYAAPAPAPPGPGGVVGMGGMMTPPGTGYYYPPAPGGVYYG